MAGQGDDYTTDSLIDYPYSKKHKLIAIDLGKQQAFDVNPKRIQQINFSENLGQQTTMFSLLKKQKKQF